ncbi:hypothetical protein [Promicromonospora sp. NFX87]|uniref:hypothetical protein n=1 Tax=Promicromonospora sp. NFX87 TaxID=3402691 RepID=UPI003AFACE7C
MENERFPVPAHASAVFTEIAQGLRVTWHMLRSSPIEPNSGSNLARADDLYPFEKVSVRARHYVSAALEHLIMWADFAAPLKFHPDQATMFTLQPALALARAALESAAQAVWLLDTLDPVECVRRHLRLIRWDLEEHRKSHLEPDGKDRVKQRENELVQRVAQVFTERDIRPPQGYLWVIQQACRPDDLALDPAPVERLWRAMSGAAHGMYWTNQELSKIEVNEGPDPNRSRTVLVPDADIMAEALDAAFRMTQYATLKYLTYAGADIEGLVGGAQRWLAASITLKPGAASDTRQRLAALRLSPDPIRMEE